jgi:hypothetical protein
MQLILAKLFLTSTALGHRLILFKIHLWHSGGTILYGQPHLYINYKGPINERVSVVYFPGG